jgi:hypothetical protein
MTEANAMAEDSFEKAREEFFGLAKTSTESSASLGESLKPRNEPAPRES